MPSMVKVAKKNASGGKVCHLESRLQMRFALRSSGQITFALGFRLTQDFFLKDLFGNLFKMLAAGGIFNLAASGESLFKKSTVNTFDCRLLLSRRRRGRDKRRRHIH